MHIRARHRDRFSAAPQDQASVPTAEAD